MRWIPNDNLVQRDPEGPDICFGIVEFTICDNFGCHPQGSSGKSRTFRIRLEVRGDSEITEEDFTSLCEEDVCGWMIQTRISWRDLKGGRRRGGRDLPLTSRWIMS